MDRPSRSRALWSTALLTWAVQSALLPAPARAEDQAEINRQLLHRLEQLEKEVIELRKVAGVAAPAATVASQPPTARLEELEQKVRVLDRKNELATEAATEKAKTAPVVTAGPGGFQLRSADTNFVATLHGNLQVDGRFFPDDNSAGTANDTILLRSVRPILEGTVYGKYDFRIMLDVASGTTSGTGNNGFIQDAYVTARFIPEFQVRAGKFKEPVGLERLQSESNVLFVERGFPTQLVPNRDVGIQVQGDLFQGTLNYQAGLFNGVADGGSGDIESADDEKEFAGRLFAHPFKLTSIEALRGLGIGIAGTAGNQEGALRTFTTPGQQRFFGYRTGAGSSAATANVVADGEHWRLAPQAYYYWGPFGVFGEYVLSEQQVRRDDGAATFGTLRHTAWQVAASYILTGEDNSFKALAPRKPLNPGDGGWGAWELTSRVGSLDVDGDAFPRFANPLTAATGALSWGVGVNWHLNRNLKLSLNYEQTEFDLSNAGVAPNAVRAPLIAKGEKAVLFRAQVAF